MVLLILDAGHGGIDTGAVKNGIVEKDFNLMITRYQFQRFRELGFEVQMTRFSDIELKADRRTKIVRESGATYCISNHANAGGGKGAEIIHSIFNKNSRFPTLLKKEFQRVGMNTRRIFTKKNNNGLDWYYMHRETGSVKTYIVEYGFLDHKDDAKFLKKNWKQLAEATIKAFCEFTNVIKYEPPEEKNDNKDSWWIVQAGAFDEKKKADNLAKSLKSHGFDAYVWKKKN